MLCPALHYPLSSYYNLHSMGRPGLVLAWRRRWEARGREGLVVLPCCSLIFKPAFSGSRPKIPFQFQKYSAPFFASVSNMQNTKRTEFRKKKHWHIFSFHT